MKRHVLLAATAAAIAFAHVPAHATASSSASITSFSYTLYDLTPWDAYDNELSLTFSDALYSISGTAFNSNPHESSSVVSGASAVRSTSQSDIAVTSLPNNLISSGAAQGTNGTVGIDSSTYEATSGFSGSFTLSPNTRVVFQIQANLSSNTTSADLNIHPGNDEYASAGAVITIRPYYSASDPDQGIFNVTDQWVDAQTYWDAGSWRVTNLFPPFGLIERTSSSFNGPLNAEVSNETSYFAEGIRDYGVEVQGHSFAAAVPEPETYAMMLAGLGAIGFIARRRQRQ